MMSTENRLEALTAVRAAMPHLDDDTALRVAEWSLTGSAPLDPARVEAAAKTLADALGRDFNVRDVQNTMRGIAQTVITAYTAPPAS